MKDWGKKLFDEYADKKFGEGILREVKRTTGHDGELKIKHEPWYSIHKTGKSRTDVVIRKPELSTNTPWDLFFYGWELADKALRAVGVTEGKTPVTALYMIIRYMRNNYTTWYRENRRVLDAMKRNLTHMPVD